MSRAQLTSTVEQSSGGAVSPYVAGKNFLINGGFDIAQRGTSITSNGNYTLDRWYGQYIGGGTVTQQSSGSPNGSQYYVRNTSTASAGGVNLYQFIETANVSQMWGKTITLSVLLRKNSTMSANIQLTLFKSSTIDAGIAQHPGTSLGSVTISNANLPTGTGSSNWYLATLTVAIPNDGTANSVYLQIGPSANIATGAYYDVAQAQLEIGSVATPFSRAGGTLQGELAACQRYYYRAGYNGAANSSTLYNYPFLGTFQAGGTTTAEGILNLPVFMRVPPISIDTMAASNYALDYGSSSFALTGLTISTYGKTGFTTVALSATVSSGLTNGYTYYARSYFGANAYIGVSAEL